MPWDLQTTLKGPTGAQGNPGPQGQPGMTGPPGPQGDAGPPGVPGTQGNPGPTGPAGPQGAPGPQGSGGPPGPQGNTGPAGGTGPQGPQGLTGAPGPTGPQGAPGAQGLPGDPGATGPPGTTGAQGPQGIQGVQGPQGIQGPAGVPSYTEGTYTVTATGYASAVTGTARYVQVGSLVTLQVPQLSGTSNAETLTLTGLPVALQPTQAAEQVVAVQDAGLTREGRLSVAAGSSTMTVYPNVVGNSWTTSGTKRLMATVVSYVRV